METGRTGGPPAYSAYVPLGTPDRSFPVHSLAGTAAKVLLVFGSIDSGVSNYARADGFSFLDLVWAEAPFPDHSRFRATVGRTSADWLSRGLLTERERSAIMEAADKASGDLRL